MEITPKTLLESDPGFRIKIAFFGLGAWACWDNDPFKRGAAYWRPALSI